MFKFLPINNYQARQIKGYSKIIFAAIITILILGNIITAIIKTSVNVNRDSYTLKDGFPIFISQFDYIELIKNYPYDPGVKLLIHKMQKGESYWDITMKYNVTIDTIIAANPFLINLIAYEDVEIVIPSKNGVLLAFDDFIDVIRMNKKLKYKNKITTKYLPTIFKLFSTDDIRLAFYENIKPILINISLERLYKQKNIFQSPIHGYFTSMFGGRRDPIWNSSHFHNGIDIKASMNSKFYPAREGVVTYTGWRSGYGKTIIIQHHDGYSTLYGHCNKLLVKVGDWVKKNTNIGLIGSTGRSTGPHLHFTLMKHGKYLNPLLHIW